MRVVTSHSSAYRVYCIVVALFCFVVVVRLRKDKVLVRGRDFELVPEAIWKSLQAWYGGQPGLPRNVKNTF